MTLRYRYRARDTSGAAVQGEVEAEGEAQAVQQLTSQGLLPFQVEPLVAAGTTTGRKVRGRVKMADQVLLLRELATLLQAGVTLGDALPSLAQAYADQALGLPLQALLREVRGGGRISDALAAPGLKLPPYVLALAEAGEASGQLARALDDAADQLELERKAGEDLRSALVYPTILVVAGLLAVLIVFIGVVPRFAPILRSSRGEIPELSRWVIETGVFLRAHVQAVGLSATALLLLLGMAAGRAEVRQWALERLLRWPLVGPWLLQGEIGRWATVLGALLGNRVPIVEALALSARVLKIRALRDGIARAGRSLQQGQNLADALASQGWFPPARLNLVRVGERSGELPKMLLALGHAQAEQARVTQKRLLTLIEPAAILLIGGVIGVVMVAVMMAITGINQMAG